MWKRGSEVQGECTVANSELMEPEDTKAVKGNVSWIYDKKSEETRAAMQTGESVKPTRKQENRRTKFMKKCIAAKTRVSEPGEEGS